MNNWRLLESLRPYLYIQILGRYSILAFTFLMTIFDKNFSQIALNQDFDILYWGEESKYS